MNETGQPHGLSRKNQLVIVVLAGGIGLAIVGLVNLASMFGSRPAAAQPAGPSGIFRPSDAQWKSLTLVPVQTRDFERTETAEGKIAVDEDHTTQVFSPFTGQVTRVFAEAGQHVSAHAPLFAVRANEIVQGHSDLSSALGALATAEAQLKLARETEARQADLYRSAGGALKDWRQAQSDVVAAEGTVRSAEAALGAARSRLAILGQTLPQIETLERTPITAPVGGAAVVYAPVGGVITRRALGAGQNITPGGDALFSISNLSSVWLVAQVRESDAGEMRLGASVSVTTPAYPGRRFTARITYVAPELDPDTHRLPVRATLANSDGALKPEMFARFEITSGSAGRGAAAPEAAIIRDGDSARVWVAGSDGALRIRAVSLGVAAGGLVQVTAGLQPGERVVTKGALFVDHAGQPD